MAIIYTYSKVIPTVDDSVVITDASDNNYTKTALLSDVVALATDTTYDLSSVQNGGDSDIKLIGSDATTDIVKLVAGANIVLTDTGSNITIDSSGTYSWIANDAVSSYTIGNTEQINFLGTGGITVVGTESPGSPYTFTVDGSAIPAITSITLDFNSALVPAPTDTGLKVWNPGLGVFQERLTLTTNGSFDIGGILNINNGGTGLETSDYTDGDMLYYDVFNAELQTVPIGVGGEVLTVDAISGFPSWAPAAGGGGTVTSVTTVNAIGASSGIKFLANPNPIIGAGVIDFEYSGNKGDILYADTTTSLKQLGAGLDRSVLTVVSGYPEWQDRLHVKDEGATIDVSVDTMDFVGAGVTVTNTGGGPASGNVTVTIPGGGGGATASGTFMPILVTQGTDGTGTLIEIPDHIYLEQLGRYYIQGDQLYIDFYIVFRQEGEEPVPPTSTLGVSAFDVTGTTPATNVLGLQGIDALAANLNTTKKNNAGVHITEVYNDQVEIDEGWQKAPRGGKLNKFYDVGTDSAKGVAWFHWVKHADGGIPGNLPPTSFHYNVYDGDPWTSGIGGNPVWTIAGSLNPINVEIL